jgi:hypothetical protein
MLIAARSFLDFGAKRGALMAPGDGEVILQRILISLVFFAIFGNDPRIVTLAPNAGMSAEEAAKEWAANVIPGITVIPSGTWGVNRAQEHGCTYCAGG